MTKTLHIIAFLLLTISSSDSLIYGKNFVFATHTKPPVSDRTTDLYTEIFKRMGYTFKVELLPGLRVLRDVNNGKYDGDMSRIRTIKLIANENIDNYRIINEPLFTMTLVMVTLKNSNIIEASWEKVNEGSVSFIRGSERIRKGIKSENRIAVGDVNQTLKLVSLGRVKSAVLFHLDAFEHIKNDSTGQFDNLKIQPHVIDSFDLYGFVHKKNIHLIPIIENILKEMKIDGSYKAINSKYLN
ncbi:MAG: hypothetical protein COA74_06985 [Gammaproteobacteria bacterium]|nr:MAG: hypothetical protein COA74_06985 [Gammaproteobacteria bacterium]